MWVLVKKKNSLEIPCCRHVLLLILVKKNNNRERSLGFAAAVCQEEGILWL
jgi:hypothetical protein